MRDDQGNIVPLLEFKEGTGDSNTPVEALFKGMEEKIPHHVGQLVRYYISTVTLILLTSTMNRNFQ